MVQNCELRVLSTSGGSLTAQRRSDPNEDTGFSFVNCKVTGKGAATVYLGRAWGAYSRVVFAFTEIAGIINPVGWYSWGDTAVEGYATLHRNPNSELLSPLGWQLGWHLRWHSW